MNENTPAIRFLYGTVSGRCLTKLILKSRADRLAARFLTSGLSRPMIGRFARKHGIPLTKEQRRSFRSFQDFFARKQEGVPVDITPEHLISPCDGWLSVYPIGTDSGFSIKGSHYRLEDLLQDRDLARTYLGGDCLIFRLRPNDYHRYCYIDDGWQGEHHSIPGVLHSVQPIACETFPVYTLNSRCWSLMITEHFGPVVQTEVGALLVGSIVNEMENTFFTKGMEMGHFELAGSTIVLLFQKDRISLLPEIRKELDSGKEFRVELGKQIGRCLTTRDTCVEPEYRVE